MRILSAATSIALVSLAAGFASFASAAAPQVTTQPASAISATDATLNGLNGDTDATATAFWVATSTFSAASSTSPSLPDGVYSTGALPAAASSTAFSAQLSSATIPAGLLPITPGTTYYYTAWSEVGGVWYPGETVSFTTLPSAPTVTGISPTTGATTGGTSVTITGTGFDGATAVNFGSTSASFVSASSTSITAIAPAASSTGPVDVTVTTAGGTSATSSSDVFTYTAAATTTPVISNVQASVTGTSTATISWTTDIPSIGNVSYGTTTSYGSNSSMELAASTTHAVNLTGLQEGTLYHYRVNAGTATSSDHTFVTQSTASSTPLAVTGVDAVQSTGVADNLFADGWKWVMHITVPDNEDAFRIRFSDWGNASSSFAANGNIRLSTAQSSNASTTSSGMISSGNGYSDWFYLTGDNATSTAGRQIDLTVEVKIPFGTANGSYSSNYTAQTFPSTATSTAP